MEKKNITELKISQNFPDLLSNDELNSKNIFTNSKLENKFGNQYLKNKTKRCSEYQEDNIISNKFILKNQLEFYFSDENLVHDKFLQKFFLRNDNKGVPISIIENFNKVRKILSDVKDLSKRINIIKDVVESSNKLKIDYKKNKINRIVDFVLNDIDYNKIDERTIYVENLPNNINHDILISIFSRCGKVAHVSIPKFFEDKKSKGFGFIIFEVIYYLYQS